jgi:hypothetical protein
MTMILSLLAAVSLNWAAPEERPIRRLPPVDLCASDQSFAAFRVQLRQAIAGKDRAFILAMITDDIEVDFGGGAGRGDFERTWTLDRPETSPLWEELGEVLDLGCVPDGEGLYWSPSMFREEGIDDPFSAALAIHPGGALHEAADASSPVVATLDWDLLTVPEWNGEAAWQRAQTADGRSGYVRSSELRSPIDYRAGFRKIDGRWRMIVFIAGD